MPVFSVRRAVKPKSEPEVEPVPEVEPEPEVEPVKPKKRQTKKK